MNLIYNGHFFGDRISIQRTGKRLKNLCATVLLSGAGILFGAEAARAENVLFAYALDADLSRMQKECGEGISIKTRNGTLTRIAVNKVMLYCVKMRSGSVETAITVSAILATERFSYVISSGPFGALSGKIQRGDWVRVSKVVAYQMSLPKEFLLDMAEGASLPVAEIASGESFIRSDSERTSLFEETSCTGVDMNLFGLAAVCQRVQIPLVAYRQCSDFADEQAGADFARYVADYKGEGVNLVLDYVRRSSETFDKLVSNRFV